MRFPLCPSILFIVKLSNYWDLAQVPLFDVSLGDGNKLLEALAFEVIADLAELVKTE